MSGYQWDFTDARLSRRKGGRLFLVYDDGREQQVDPVDVDEVERQYMSHCRAGFHRLMSEVDGLNLEDRDE